MNRFAAMAKAPEDLRELAEEWPLLWLLKLPPGANVVVAGAYRGKVMALLATAYPEIGRLVGFEPQESALIAAVLRLRGAKPRVQVEPYGLGIADGTFPMADDESIFASFLDGAPRSKNPKHGEGRLREAGAALESIFGMERIDLMLLNIEGYEWHLLPHLLRNNWFSTGRIRRLALQVHWGFGYDHTLADIAHELEHTHKRVFDEIPSWGYWQWSGAE